MTTVANTEQKMSSKNDTNRMENRQHSTRAEQCPHMQDPFAEDVGV